MRKFLSLFLMACMSVGAFAYSAKIDGIYYDFHGWDNTAGVTYRDQNYNSYSGKVVIPATVEYNGTEYAVTSIGNQAFRDCSSLTTITLPNSITSIQDLAFCNCSSLTTITLPNSIMSIGSGAFRDCSSLTTITLPNSITSIGSGAFSGCSSLTTITLPNSITSIGSSAFSGCSSLTTITLPNSITSIGEYAFSKTPFWSNQPDGVVYFGNMLYKYKGEMPDNTSIVVKNGTTIINRGAFYQCKGLTSITIPNSVTNIGSTALMETSITEITLPTKLKEIDVTALNSTHLTTINVAVANPYYCSIEGVLFSKDQKTLVKYPQGKNNATYSIPEGVVTIEGYAFESCANLSSVFFPKSVNTIQDYAFLRSGLHSATIPNSVKHCGGGIFYSCDSLVSVVLSTNLTEIPYLMFSNCSSLKKVSIPNGVTSIGSDAFSSCRSLDSVIIPNSVTNIDNGAFEFCTNLSSINIPRNVTKIGEYAFEYCSQLSSITFGYGTLVNIKNNAFNECTNLHTIYNNSDCMQFILGSTEKGKVAYYASTITTSIDKNATFIFDENLGDYPVLVAYNGYADVAELTLPDSYNGKPYIIGSKFLLKRSLESPGYNYQYTTTSICDNSGNNCTEFYISVPNVESVNIPSSVIGIEPFAFSGKYDSWNSFGNYSIKNIRFAENSVISEIPANAFSGCNNLTDINLPQGITSIGDYAFSECNRLTNINLPQGITSIGDYAFSNCGSQKKIYIPKQLVQIGKNAFATNNIDSIIVESGNKVYDSRNNCNAIIETQTNTIVQGCNNTIIPNSVIKIGTDAFTGYQNLTTITIPKNIQNIGDHAFSDIPYILIYCESTAPIQIGHSVISRDDAYFVVSNVDTYKSKWTEYANHIISNSLANKEVTVNAHSSKSALHQALGINDLNKIVKLKINGTINSYDIMMIRNQMPRLRELDLSDVTIIANSYEYTKGYCSKNDTLTSYSFTGTGTKLYKVILPKTLKHIEPNGFNNALRDLTISNGAIAPKAFNTCSGIEKLTLCEGVTAIGAEAFRGRNITSLSIPNTVQFIGNAAFAGCSALGSVLIDGVTTIGSSAFSNCSALGSVTMGDGITTIGSSAFSNCSALSSVTMGNKVTHIGNQAFYDCSALRSINLPESLTSIGESAFQGAGLIEVTIPANVETIEKSAFGGKSKKPYYYRAHYYNNKNSNEEAYYSDIPYSDGSLQSIIIPKNSKLKTISAWAFAGNNNLKTVSILGDSIISIGIGAFYCCQLDTLILPPHLQELNTLSFGECSGLKFVAMPNSLTEIASNAFAGCTNLDNIQFPKKLTKIGHHAFADCTNLRNVDIPGLVTDIEEYAFKDCNVRSVYSYLFDPFTIGQNTFSPYANANATLFVPNVEDTEMKYLYDTQWSQFLNRQRMDKNFEYDDFYGKGDINIKCEDDPLNGNPNATLYPGAGLIIEDNNCDTTGLGNITIGGDGNNDWGSIIAGCNLRIDSLIQHITVMGKKWYFFGFPFEVRIADIQADAKYVIYEYDGQMRAERDTTGWKRLPKNQEYLYPGHGYIFQFNFSISGDISIIIPSPRFCEMLEKIILKFFPSDKTNNKSWNYASNPFLGYYDINDLNITTPITIWDVAQGTYRTIRPGDDDYYFSPYEGFFLQNTEERDFELTFDRNKAMTKKQLDEQRDTRRQAMARAQQRHSGRAIINLTLASESASDDTRIVINEGAGMGYELGLDAAKFLSTENSVPQIFSYDDSNVQYSINERPMQTGVVELGVRIPASGMYTIDAPRMDTTMYLLDRKMNIMHDFSTGAYMFSAGAGMQNNRFALVRQYNAPTDAEETIENTQVDVTAEGLYIHGTADIQVYNMAGVCVADGTYSGAVTLPAGIYMVVSGGNTTKCVVR